MYDDHRAPKEEISSVMREFYQLKDDLKILDQLTRMPQSERTKALESTILDKMNPSQKAVTAAKGEIQSLRSEIELLTKRRQELRSENDRAQLSGRSFSPSDYDRINSAVRLVEYAKANHKVIFPYIIHCYEMKMKVKSVT